MSNQAPQLLPRSCDVAIASSCSQQNLGKLASVRNCLLRRRTLVYVVRKERLSRNQGKSAFDVVLYLLLVFFTLIHLSFVSMFDRTVMFLI